MNQQIPTGPTATHAIPPHGGTLINRELTGRERDEALARAKSLTQIALGPVAVSDLELLSIGGFSPLTGFMGSADYQRVVKEARLANGLVWSLPVTLAVSKEEAAGIKEGQEIALADQGTVLGLLTVREKFGYDKKQEAQQVYRTEDEAHPGVARLYQQGDVLLGGDVSLLNHPASTLLYPEHQFAPSQSRAAFAERGWKRIVAFQTRNPIHRAHEYIQKCALEVCDGLFLHPLVGETKGDDISAPVRMRSYTRLLEDYYPKDRTLLGVFPAAMRYAGPREAIFHAMVRKNYGCTHLIVGRDHAGVGNYYGTYDAQRIFDDFPAADLGITPLNFEHSFFCKRCAGMASAKTCPHDKTNHVTLSGTQVRAMLVAGEIPPLEFTRPEVAALLAAEMKGK